MPLWLASFLWGLLGGSALLLGAGIGFLANVRQRIVAGVMAFGSGVMISALAFDLMDESFKRGGFDAAAIGFISGAVVYTAANWLLAVRVRATANVPASNNPLKVTTQGAVGRHS